MAIKSGVEIGAEVHTDEFPLMDRVLQTSF